MFECWGMCTSSLINAKEKGEMRQKNVIDLHQPGIEPGAPAWQAGILPLNH